jgi:hypothetical protein
MDNLRADILTSIIVALNEQELIYFELNVAHTGQSIRGE